jgi:hypothetical protein
MPYATRRLPQIAQRSILVRAQSLFCSSPNGLSLQVSFRFKEGHSTSSSSSTHFGFIAQEVREVFPELVHEDDDGWLGLEYQSLIPLLVEEVKRQQAQIQELNNGFTRQEAELKWLRTSLESLRALKQPATKGSGT